MDLNIQHVIQTQLDNQIRYPPIPNY